MTWTRDQLRRGEVNKAESWRLMVLRFASNNELMEPTEIVALRFASERSYGAYASSRSHAFSDGA